MREFIADRDIQPAVTAPAGLITSDETRWTVVLDADGRPVAAVSPGGRDLADDLVVVSAETSVADLVQWQRTRRVRAGTVVVVRLESGALGVWAPADRVRMITLGVSRESAGAMASDFMLPGVISKKNITRRCRQVQSGVPCASVLVVPEKPEVMPECPEQDGLGAHAFVW